MSIVRPDPPASALPFLVSCYQPHRVQNAGQPAQHAEDDVDQQVLGRTHLQERTQWGQQDGTNQVNDIHTCIYSQVFGYQYGTNFPVHINEDGETPFAQGE